MPTYRYPRPQLTVDIAVFRRTTMHIEVLLIQRAHQPFKNYWALPGGFINMRETLKQSAARELEEETGLVALDLVQVHTYGDPDRDPRGRVVSVAYATLLDGSTVHPIHPGSDAGEADWFPLEELPEMAFDHQQIIMDACSRMADRLN